MARCLHSLENTRQKGPRFDSRDEEGAKAEDDKDDKHEDNEDEMRMNLKIINDQG